MKLPSNLFAVTASRSVIVAGAGIGGLTAALALARSGFRVTVLEQAERLSETGAGIQLFAECHALSDRARRRRRGYSRM